MLWQLFLPLIIDCCPVRSTHSIQVLLSPNLVSHTLGHGERDKFLEGQGQRTRSVGEVCALLNALVVYVCACLGFQSHFMCCLRSFYSCVAWFCCVGFRFFGTRPRDWLGRTSPKWPVLCRVGRKTFLNSVSQSVGYHLPRLWAARSFTNFSLT